VISAAAVGLVGLGGALVHAGLTGQSPLSSIRSIATGSPTPITGGTSAVVPAAGATGEGFTPLVSAVNAYIGDTYSQTKRWADGYSDCSSFVGKGFKALGITPPGGSTTFDYAVWGKVRSIPRSQVAAGDLLVKPGVHMAVATSATTAIGQQNRSSNVRTGSIDSIMFGATPFVCLRYVG
jgi:cell wall-associated NlpC family hydrolase